MNFRAEPHRQIAFMGVALSLLLLCRIGFAQDQPIRFTQLPKEVIESRLRRAARSNDEREAILANMFMESGCDGEHLTEQPLPDRKQANLICTLQGSPSVVIVGAHFDHVLDYGMGVVDNWSGASLLPSLFESLKSLSPRHTFRFIGFAEEEKGLIGSRFYAGQLRRDELMGIRAMIDLDSLGLGPSKIWLTHSDPNLAKIVNGVATALHISIGVVDADRVGDEDSTPFRKLHVPTLMLHSITQQTLGILHSNKDNISQIHLDDYYDSYRLIDAYLTYVDQALD